ncbi:hypothetical protein CLOP_g21839 [Closterium sp. NIES-67]|nr:hypothetical protein CLOP_g21839 [Closterium sp. NIES-67]
MASGVTSNSISSFRSPGVFSPLTTLLDRCQFSSHPAVHPQNRAVSKLRPRASATWRDSTDSQAAAVRSAHSSAEELSDEASSGDPRPLSPSSAQTLSPPTLTLSAQSSHDDRSQQPQEESQPLDLNDPRVLACCEPLSASGNSQQQQQQRPLRVAVLLSGGVDSSVALRLLHAAGHECEAFYLKIWFQEDFENFWSQCPWEDDLAMAQAVCDEISVPLRIVHLTDAYWQRVVSHCVAEIRNGRTPNPDMLCNSRIKFGAFYDHIDFAHFDRVASGHYARVVRSPPPLHTSDQPGQAAPVRLVLSADEVKDQTYFLSHLSQQQLSRVMFPLGALAKSQVRQLAASFNLPNQNRKDSQGICFLGKVKFSEFVARHVGEQEGLLVEAESGEALGTHRGFWFFTIGQRQGIKLSGGPWYVVAKDTATNTVFVSRNYHSPNKSRRQFWVGGFSWTVGGECDPPLSERPNLTCKVRHGPHFYSCSVQFGDPPASMRPDAMNLLPAGTDRPPQEVDGAGNYSKLDAAQPARSPAVHAGNYSEPAAAEAAAAAAGGSALATAAVAGSAGQPAAAAGSVAGPAGGEPAVLVTLSRDDQGLAAGQFAAFYDGDVCLGLGVIVGVPAGDTSEDGRNSGSGSTSGGSSSDGCSSSNSEREQMQEKEGGPVSAAAWETARRGLAGVKVARLKPPKTVEKGSGKLAEGRGDEWSEVVNGEKRKRRRERASRGRPELQGKQGSQEQPSGGDCQPAEMVIP